MAPELVLFSRGMLRVLSHRANGCNQGSALVGVTSKQHPRGPSSSEVRTTIRAGNAQTKPGLQAHGKTSISHRSPTNRASTPRALRFGNLAEHQNPIRWRPRISKSQRHVSTPLLRNSRFGSNCPLLGSGGASCHALVPVPYGGPGRSPSAFLWQDQDNQIQAGRLWGGM